MRRLWGWGIGAAALAGVVAYASARFLLRYLRLGRLDPFAYYCAALGARASSSSTEGRELTF